ncbi:MAG: NADH-quinone oxidoreductase subunit NuoE [Oscillospiraceae bacterium]|jgi:NADH:ubiquinone oxidoreductase subunit E|nr:NADH-quinone oxidoreductase subunit NuoE [Oscillospiraceae bacterium]
MTDTEIKQATREDQFAKLAAAIQNHKGERGALMPVLQEAQSIFGFVPQDVQVAIAKGLDVPLTEVYGVATFYSQFALEERGEHIIGMCLGTACYVRGAQKILDRLSSELDVKVGHSTKDGQFTLNATRCLGACGLAPVMMIDDEVYGRLTSDEIPAILAKYREPKAS